MSPLETRFTREYVIRDPIAQAPMAFVGTTPDAAVPRAGGLGLIRAGQGVGLIREVAPVAWIVEERMAEATSALASVATGGEGRSGG